jgi:hypothetical protein
LPVVAVAADLEVTIIMAEALVVVPDVNDLIKDGRFVCFASPIFHFKNKISLQCFENL